MAPSPPRSIYQSSIYSGYSFPYPTYCGNCGSRERLLPAKKKKPVLLHTSNLRYSGPRTTAGRVVRSADTQDMANDGIEIVNEQRKSYGIGGAGNIRRPSDVIYPPRVNMEGTRRRSSVWSSITTTNASPSASPEGRRFSLMSLFSRKGSTAVLDGEAEGYKETDLGEGKKH